MTYSVSKCFTLILQHPTLGGKLYIFSETALCSLWSDNENSLPHSLYLTVPIAVHFVYSSCPHQIQNVGVPWASFCP